MICLYSLFEALMLLLAFQNVLFDILTQNAYLAKAIASLAKFFGLGSNKNMSTWVYV
jgi:hypothetical protein